MKVALTLLLLIFLSGCSGASADSIPADGFAEEVYFLPGFNLNVAGGYSEWSNPKLQQGGYTGGAARTRVNGIGVDQIWILGKEVNGKLEFADNWVAGHELQHLMHYEYPEEWSDPDD